MSYAFIGLGRLGQHLAGRLARQFEVRVYDRSRDSAAALEALGARFVSSSREAVEEVDAVFTCLPSPDASRSLMFGEQGCLGSLQPGALWAELSTVGPAEIAAFASEARRFDVALMDCPVTGGVHRAARGEMTMFVGGEKSQVAQHRKALDAMCSPVLHLGAVGSASTAKLITNMLCMVDLIAAGDAILLAERAGLDLAEFYRAVVASSGNSREFEDWAPRILDGSYDTGFTLSLALKDMRFTSDLSRGLDVPMNLLDKVVAMLEEARGEFGGDAMTANVFRQMARRANVDFEPVQVGDDEHV